MHTNPGAKLDGGAGTAVGVPIFKGSEIVSVSGRFGRSGAKRRGMLIGINYLCCTPLIEKPTNDLYLFVLSRRIQSLNGFLNLEMQNSTTIEGVDRVWTNFEFSIPASIISVK